MRAPSRRPISSCGRSSVRTVWRRSSASSPMAGCRTTRDLRTRRHKGELIWTSSSNGCSHPRCSCRRPCVRDPHTYDYAVVRVVPRVERAEFVNAGIILSCDVERILLAKIELDEAALLALDANVDLELVKQSLASIPKISAGGPAAGDIGKMTPRERFHWL